VDPAGYQGAVVVVVVVVVASVDLTIFLPLGLTT
jgi:hypothetical protein